MLSSLDSTPATACERNDPHVEVDDFPGAAMADLDGEEMALNLRKRLTTSSLQLSAAAAILSRVVYGRCGCSCFEVHQVWVPEACQVSLRRVI